jgi:hypothetical protein
VCRQLVPVPLASGCLRPECFRSQPCVAAIAACNANISGSCLVATDTCNLGLEIPYTLTGMNPYDMREKCKVPPLCYDFSNVGKYLARPEVVAALGVGKRKWSDW